jgi:hypothetical protein
MKNQIIVVGLIFIFVGLSGCQEGGIGFDQPTELDINEKHIRTVLFYYKYTILLRDILVPDSDIFTFHPDMEAYEIHGSIVHHGDKSLGRVQMEANYFDENSNLLVSQKIQFIDVPPEINQYYLFRFDDNEYFEIVKSVNFSFYIFDE